MEKEKDLGVILGAIGSIGIGYKDLWIVILCDGTGNNII